MTVLQPRRLSLPDIGWIALLAVLLLSLSGCSRDASPPEPGDVAVARVDGHTIWASDVRLEAVAQGQVSEGEPLDITSDLFQRTLEDVIYRKLMAKEARAKRLDRAATAQRRLQAAEDRILADMLVEDTLEGAVDENKVRQLYNEQVRQSKSSDEIRARLILVESRTKADTLVEQIKGGAQFDDLAREHSLDQSTRPSGGDLGYVSSDLMPQALKSSLTGAAVGQVVGPVETEDGWVILRVEDRRPEVPLTFEESRPQIVRFLTFDQLRALLSELRKAAKVEILLPSRKSTPPESSDDGKNARPEAAPDASAAASPTGRTKTVALAG